MTPESRKPRGLWQFAVFALALSLAVFVWGFFPEPEESRRGYTPRGCYQAGKLYFNDARMLKGLAHASLRCERYLTAVRYLRALELRFGIGRSRWDAYDMLADANYELATLGEEIPELRERFRLDSPRALREEALRAYREASVRVEEDVFKRRVIRKEAKVLVELGRPDEALVILRGLVKLYRQSKVDSLRRERGEDTEFGAGVAQALRGDAAELEQEARSTYLLTGRAAMAAAEFHLTTARKAPSDQIREEEELLSQARSDEAVRAFRLFVEAGGAGERRVAAEKALGDLAFRRSQGLAGADRRRALEEARTHYGAAGTRETALLLARVLFGLGEYDDAKSRFARRRNVTPAEARARDYMVARCDLAMGRLNDAKAGFASIHDADAETAEGVSSLVGLARIALKGNSLDRAARFLSRAVAAGAPESSGIELPERDGWLEPAAVAPLLVSLARAFDEAGEFDRAVALYRDAARLDPEGPARALRLVARAWEKKAAVVEEQPAREALGNAAAAYVRLAELLGAGPARREAERLAAEGFAKGGLYSRAIEVARRFVVRHPRDRFTSRVLHDLGTWEAALGLSAKAREHFTENKKRHPTDVYADRSRVELAKVLVAGGADGDLREAGRELRAILEDEDRYGPDSLVRLEALFMLGHVDLRLAERLVLAGGDPGEAQGLFAEAGEKLREALASRMADSPADGPNARPLFAELADREMDAASAALRRIARGEIAPAEVTPLSPGELGRKLDRVSRAIESLAPRLVQAAASKDVRED